MTSRKYSAAGRRGRATGRLAREAGADRKTVARYTAAATRLGVARGEELTDEEVHQVAQCVQARALVAPSDEWNEVAQHRERIEHWLAGDGDTRPLRLSKIHTLLAARSRPARQLRHAPALRPPRSSRGATSRPRCASTIRHPVRRRRSTSARWARSWTPRRDIAGALGAHRDAVVQPLPVRLADVPTDHRGRVRGTRPRLDVLRGDHRDGDPRQHQGDGARSRRAQRRRSSPAFLDYVQARGLFVDPARVRSPKDKPRVENQVAFVRESWFDGETFTDLDHARRDARALVSRDRRRTRARHHPSRSARDVRVDREGDDAGRTDGALRRAGLDRQSEGPSGSSHPVAAGPLLRPASVPSQARSRARRSEGGEDLLRHRADQDARAPAARGTFDRRRRLPRGQERVCPARRRRAPRASHDEGIAHRHLRRASARRTAAMDQDATGVCAARSLRQVRRRPRRGHLPERARVRRRRCLAHRPSMLKSAAKPARPRGRGQGRAAPACRASLVRPRTSRPARDSSKKEGV